MGREFTARGMTAYIDVLKDILQDYNNTKHCNIGMNPVAVSKKFNEEIVRKNIYGDHICVRKKSSKFKVNHRVRKS